ncbi:FBD-associated F-box protein [Rhynchospora pubera]|uniref:FBD-associated F-box protein n=2 Tax=Rhynchospora pubera TaxID=906938 RepID=A0AAV8BWK6_9POAL|nr:FBD-associated F-box protein [Rhynchospora pubera]
MNETIDRLSSLPDDILIHILSFLRTREAVQTCILSKRWRNTWASVPVLNFHVSDYNENESWKFDQFVNGVLENRGPALLDTIISSRYVGDRYIDPPPIGWLHRATLLMPRVISVDIPDCYGWDLDFPDSVFSCSSLEKLELFHFSQSVPAFLSQNSIALASLKTLVLEYLTLHDDFMQKLFLGCPVLENLKLWICELDISDISSNALKEFTLDDCQHLQPMRISCPGLVSLSITSSMNIIRIISLENMASLVNASIKFSGCKMYETKVDVSNRPNSKFLSGLSNVTNLELFFWRVPDLKELWKDISNRRTFYNLKSLDFGAWNMAKDFSLIACFLEHCPVVKQLTLRLHIRPAIIQAAARRDVPFQREYLEEVNILCVKEDKLDSKLVRVLGRHVKTIGNINIRYSNYILINKIQSGRYTEYAETRRFLAC